MTLGAVGGGGILNQMQSIKEQNPLNYGYFTVTKLPDLVLEQAAKSVGEMNQSKV